MDSKQPQTTVPNNKESDANAPADPPADYRAADDAREDTRVKPDPDANTNTDPGSATAAWGEGSSLSRIQLNTFGPTVAAILAVSARRQMVSERTRQMAAAAVELLEKMQDNTEE